MHEVSDRARRPAAPPPPRKEVYEDAFVVLYCKIQVKVSDRCPFIIGNRPQIYVGTLRFDVAFAIQVEEINNVYNLLHILCFCSFARILRIESYVLLLEKYKTNLEINTKTFTIHCYLQCNCTTTRKTQK